MGKSVFLTAGVITVLVFALVFLVVQMDEAAKIAALSDEIMTLYEEQQANKILESYLGSANQENCAIYERQISRQLNRIYELFNQLESLKDKTFATSKDKVKRQYLLTSMSLWIDLKNASENCELDIKPVLFFYPQTWLKEQPQSCVECDAMVEQLEVLKTQCPETRVFAFPSEDEDFEFVALLKNEYNVSSAPALVVKDHVVYSIVSTSELKQWLGCES